MARFRKLLPGEHGALEGHLLRLDPHDRAMRFASGVSASRIREYVRSRDPFRVTVIGYVQDGTLRGAAELYLAPAGRVFEAELAATVERPWQNRGIGTELVRRALLFARNRSIRRIHAVCLADNIKMRKIVRRFEGNMVYRAGMVEGNIELTWPTQLSFMEEVVSDSAAAIDQWRAWIGRGGAPAWCQDSRKPDTCPPALVVRQAHHEGLLSLAKGASS